jgi:sugar O-acyltransferase (sialic acid O-acetyltransferase NeuD family)
MTSPTPQPLILAGGGGHALVVAESAALAGFTITGCYDDAPAPAATRLAIPRLGPLDSLPHRAPWILTLGSLDARRRVIAAHPHPATTVTHPDATISPTASIGAGTFIGPRAIVHTLARIGDHCIINSGAIVEHECELGPNVHIAPGAVLAGNVRIAADTLVGLGARILPGITIGRGVTIAAGAVILRDVPDHTTMIGVPGRERR